MSDNNNNPTGKGGFKEHPENINRNGTPGRQGLKLLRDAMAARATKEGKTLYELFVEKAYENNTILIEALKKLVPNAQAIEVTGEMTLKDFFGVLRGEPKGEETKADEDLNHGDDKGEEQMNDPTKPEEKPA